MNREQRTFVKAVITYALKNSDYCDTWLEGEEWESNLTSADYIMQEIEHQGQAELVFIQTQLIGNVPDVKLARAQAGAFLFIDQDDDPDSPFADYSGNKFCDLAIAAGWEAIA
jgi:hypothetical protein